MTMKKSVLAGLFVFLAIGALSGPAESLETRGRKPAAPILVEPGDNADLTGRSTVRFRWSPEGGPGSYDHADFRLYKGHQTVEKGLILQKNVPSGDNFIEVDGALFTDGETYAWSVKQVGGRTKSRSAFAVFKAIKRDALAPAQP
jgi:hypothetical protein